MKISKLNAKYAYALLVTLAVIFAMIPLNVLKVYASPARVTDNAGLLSEEDLQELNEKADSVSDAHNFDVVVYTADGLDQDIESFADDYYDENGYRDDGCVLVIDMADRAYWISTKGSGIDILSGYYLQRTQNDFETWAADESYYNAINSFIDDVDYYVTDAENGGSEAAEGGTVAESSGFDMDLLPGWIILSLIIGFILSAIVTFVMKSKLKSVRANNSAVNYVVDGSLNITDEREIYLYSTVTRTEIPREENHSGGGSHVHTSSSGSTHGGGGGHF